MVQEANGHTSELVRRLRAMDDEANVEEVLLNEVRTYSRVSKFSLSRVGCAIGSRLDHAPENLFMLRGVDHLDLLASASVDTLLDSGEPSGLEDDLSSLFGIDLADNKPETVRNKRQPKLKPAKPVATKALKTKIVKKKSPVKKVAQKKSG